MTIDLGTININNPKIGNLPISEIKSLIIDFLENDLYFQKNKNIDKELKNLKITDPQSGEKLKNIFNSLGENIKIGDIDRAREEYIRQRYIQ